jgi:hypothetical protein
MRLNEVVASLTQLARDLDTDLSNIGTPGAIDRYLKLVDRVHRGYAASSPTAT